MLARLEQEDGVELAEIDRRGELLRVRVAASAEVTRAIGRLQELGFVAELIIDTAVDIPRWYGTESVGELSLEEADVIADRVVPEFARPHGIDASESDTLRDLTAKALHECFVTHTFDAATPIGALNRLCGRAVEAATSAHLGADRALGLGQAVEADLAARSAFKD